MPLEIIIFLGLAVEVFHVEHLANASRTVPEADLSLRVQSLELVENVGAHGRHTCTTTDEDHFGTGLLGEKLTKRPHNGHLVTRLQVKHEAGHDARVMIRTGRWRGNTDIELENAPLFRVVRHGVRPDGFFLVHRLLFLDNLILGRQEQ